MLTLKEIDVLEEASLIGNIFTWINAEGSATIKLDRFLVSHGLIDSGRLWVGRWISDTFWTIVMCG